MRERRKDGAPESNEAVEREYMTGNMWEMVAEMDLGFGDNQKFHGILNLNVEGLISAMPSVNRIMLHAAWLMDDG